MYYSPPWIFKVHFSILLLGHHIRLQGVGGVCFLFLPPMLMPSKCVFLLQTLSLQWRNFSGSFKLIFNIWTWLLLITSWITMKPLHFLSGALVPILIIQPYSLHFSFQGGLGSDSFHSPWTQEYSYLFCLENKANQKIILLNFWSRSLFYKSCLIFTNTNCHNLSVGFKQTW